MDVTQASNKCQEVLDEVTTAVLADRAFFEEILLGILARGNVLIEDVPGTGKTLTANLFAVALGVSFSRIQFTPDLLPADITGSNVYNERDNAFEFREGPIFTNILLGDEINRAPPKTQAALLEAMEEGQVTSEGDTRDLPEPFFVLATQNPVEQEGTFPLPEAQVDRFLIKTDVGYPKRDEEIALLRRRTERTDMSPSVNQQLTADQVRELQSVPEDIYVEDDIYGYIADISRATRNDHRVEIGASPRGTQKLLETARANAVLRGRDYVAPDDVKRVAMPVLAHRMVLTPEATIDNLDPQAVVDDALNDVSVPALTPAD